MGRISAAVVVYGGAAEAAKTLQSLADQTSEPDFVLYLVDNASPDGALETLREQGLPPCVQAIGLEQNKGFGAGHNAVLPLLQSRYHAVVNPDILLFDDALAAMADWMDAHPEVAIACPRLVYPDGREQHIAKRRPAFLPLLARQTKLGFLKKYEDHYLMLDADLSQPVDVEFCSGSFFMVRTEVFCKMGGFDEGYFMYVEDADITQKALQFGRAVYLPQITVAHAWHRAAHRQMRQFLWQLKSMGRYFRKWGFRWK